MNRCVDLQASNTAGCLPIGVMVTALLSVLAAFPIEAARSPAPFNHLHPFLAGALLCLSAVILVWGFVMWRAWPSHRGLRIATDALGLRQNRWHASIPTAAVVRITLLRASLPRDWGWQWYMWIELNDGSPLRAFPAGVWHRTREIMARCPTHRSAFAFALQGLPGGIDTVEAALRGVLPHIPVERRPAGR